MQRVPIALVILSIVLTSCDGIRVAGPVQVDGRLSAVKCHPFLPANHVPMVDGKSCA